MAGFVVNDPSELIENNNSFDLNMNFFTLREDLWRERYCGSI